MITRWHFAPTAQARLNLMHDRVPDEHIVVTGNPVVDAWRSAVATEDAA